jgi:hypothetical protein
VGGGGGAVKKVGVVKGWLRRAVVYHRDVERHIANAAAVGHLRGREGRSCEEEEGM